MKTFFIVVFTISISSCFTPHDMRNISPGMTKNEVIKALGNNYIPQYLNGVETLYYEYNYERFFINIIENKVVSYGPDTTYVNKSMFNPANIPPEAFTRQPPVQDVWILNKGL